jgi:DNA polymerase delta subunit 4
MLMRIQQPAIGIARMKRWVRANKLGLEPPIEVLAVLMREEQKGNAGIERAYVDELMSSKFVIGDA